MDSPKLSNRKQLILVLSGIGYYDLFIGFLIWLDGWFKKHSLFGITFYNIDIRIYPIGFVLAVFGVWLLRELYDYLKFKEWRRSWK